MATMRSLVNDLVMLVSRGDTFTLIDDIGSAYIADCRGAIASNFLKKHGTSYGEAADEFVPSMKHYLPERKQ